MYIYFLIGGGGGGRGVGRVYVFPPPPRFKATGNILHPLPLPSLDIMIKVNIIYTDSVCIITV